MSTSYDKKKIHDIKVFAIVSNITLLIFYFFPLFNLILKDANEVQQNHNNISYVSLLTQARQFQPFNDLGMLSQFDFSLSFLMPCVAVLYAIIMLILAFTHTEKITKWMNVITSLCCMALPLTCIISANGMKKCVANFESLGMGIGGYVCIAIGIIFVIAALKYDIGSGAYYENEDKVRLTYIIISFIVLLGLFMPTINFNYKVGLKNFVSYSMSFIGALSLSRDIKVTNVLFIFNENANNMGKLLIFYIVPVLSILTIILGILKKNSMTIIRVFADIQAVVSILSMLVIASVFKDNLPLFDGFKGFSVSYGYYVVIVASIVMLFISIKKIDAEPIKNIVARTHRIVGYKLSVIGIIGIVLYFMPRGALTVKTLNSSNLIESAVNQQLKMPINNITLIQLTHNPLAYLSVLIPVLILAIIVLGNKEKYKVSRILGAVVGILMVVMPYVDRRIMMAATQNVEIPAFSFYNIISVIIGFLFIYYVGINKDSGEAISRCKDKVNHVVQSILLILFAVVQLYPLLWLVLGSFMDEKEIFSGKVFALPKVWHVENYSKVLFGTRADETIGQAIKRAAGGSDSAAVWRFILGQTPEGNIVRYFANSIFVVGITILIVLICSAMVAYALTRIKWRGKKWGYMFFVIGMMIPVHVALAPLYIAFNDAGILGSLWSLIIPYAGFGLSFAIIVLCGFMTSIPYSFDEAAIIDGASHFTIFRTIILPLMKPALATVTIFTFMGNWNELMFASVFISKGYLRTITVGINQLATAQYNTEYGLIFAGLVVSSLPTLIFYLFASDKVQKSLLVGGVKE